MRPSLAASVVHHKQSFHHSARETLAGVVLSFTQPFSVIINKRPIGFTTFFYLVIYLNLNLILTNLNLLPYKKPYVLKHVFNSDAKVMMFSLVAMKKQNDYDFMPFLLIYINYVCVHNVFLYLFSYSNSILKPHNMLFGSIMWHSKASAKTITSTEVFEKQFRILLSVYILLTYVLLRVDN